MSSTRLDIIRAVRAAEYAIPQFGRGSKIDPDLDLEAGMDGNYQRLLQAARNLDTAHPLPNPEEAKAPSPFEVFCDLNPSDINCRVYDD